MNGIHLAAIIVTILLAIALFLRPREQPLQVDATPVAVTLGREAAANRWLMPCPQTPKNIPRQRKEWV